MSQILIVDDNEIDRFFLTSLTKKYVGCSCLHASTGFEALACIKNDKTNQIAAVLLDLSMPEMDGRTALPQLLALRPDLQVIAITGTQSTIDIVNIIKLGAADYLVKPVNFDLFQNALAKAVHMHQLRRELESLRHKDEASVQFADLIGQSSAIQTCIKLGQRAAVSDITVLITGESGTGKEMLARAIHSRSNRSSKPFVAVNCGALPKDLVESILFGHKKGSFTGAFADSLGKFMEANGGTLFLDEIGELPLEAQVKLLRALQEREIEPVGAGKSVPINIRIIAATNRSPQQAVRQGHLREDLFYRLNVFPIHMPPLRQRTDDIEPLSKYFLRHYAVLEGKSISGFDSIAEQWMKTYSWPGNVREMENAIFRATLLCDGERIRLDHLQYDEARLNQVTTPLTQDVSPASYAINLVDSSGSFKRMDKIKDEVEKAALVFSEGNVTIAAHQLGIGKSTLYRHRQS